MITVKRIESLVSRLAKFKLKHKPLLGLLFLLLVCIGAYFLLRNANFGILNPKGTIAAEQKRLIIFGSLLSLTVVVPVFIMTFWIVWKYRASNTRAKYRPDWDHSVVYETIWWVVPTILISILSVVAWRSSYALDPFKGISSDVPPVRIQVIALEWKWLFIYPQQNVASVNQMQIPLNTPIELEITSDAPMNSLWVPQLGGQIYAMAGMSTHLHLMATEKGIYEGSSANISGEGFAGMRFKVSADTNEKFIGWVKDSKKSGVNLSLDVYNKLSQPSKDAEPFRYASYENGLYDRVVMKYLSPAYATRGLPAGYSHGGSH